MAHRCGSGSYFVMVTMRAGADGLALEGQDLPRVAGRRSWLRKPPRQPARPAIRPRRPAAGTCEPLRAAADWAAAPANRTFRLGSPLRWAIDAVRQGRETATVGHRCCGNDIHGSPLRLPGPAEQHPCPIVALRPALAARCPVCQDLGGGGGGGGAERCTPGTGSGRAGNRVARIRAAAASRPVHPLDGAWRSLAFVIGEGEPGCADVFPAVAGLDR